MGCTLSCHARHSASVQPPCAVACDPSQSCQGICGGGGEGGGGEGGGGEGGSQKPTSFSDWSLYEPWPACALGVWQFSPLLVAVQMRECAFSAR